VTAVGALREAVGRWLAERRADTRFARFASHFEVLDAVLARLLHALDQELAALRADRPAGRVYERCRELDRSLVTVTRTFEWYAGKYDQRLDEQRAPALAAADELVRSCWSEPFAARGRRPPTGPLSYLEPRFDAYATPRLSVPPDLRAPADARVAEHVRELPIPTIALPDVATREAWWLVLAAHETGHHVQHDVIPGVVAATSMALADAAAASPDGGTELAGHWSVWGQEAFADAYSVLMVGPGAAWAVDELQYADPARLATVPQPGDRYPPPAVRLALLSEIADHAGMGVGARGGATAMRAWLRNLDTVSPVAREAVDRQLRVLPRIADALLGLSLDGTSLCQLSGLRPEWFAAKGRVAGWAAQLRTDVPVIAPVDTRPGARLVMAAGVAAYERLVAATAPDPDPAGQLARLHRNLLEILPACGPPGVLAPPPSAESVAALADRLANRLVRDPPAWPS
jgi:hypothetical protein